MRSYLFVVNASHTDAERHYFGKDSTIQCKRCAFALDYEDLIALRAIAALAG